MAVQVPRPVKARDLKQHLLPPVKKELGNRHVLFLCDSGIERTIAF